jgi:hypothetical protein
MTMMLDVFNNYINKLIEFKRLKEKSGGLWRMPIIEGGKLLLEIKELKSKIIEE